MTDMTDVPDTVDDDPGLDRDALAAFAVPSPAAELGDRFAVALAAQRARRRRRVLAIAGGGVAFAAAAAIVATLGFSAPRAGAEGTLAPSARTTARLGVRGVAVVEAGGRLDWKVAGSGDAAIEQDAGDVFYRVEHGGPFVVSTPAGDVRVTGTCFRVEVEPDAIAVVTVYEGAVEVRNAHGALAVAAGERAITAAQAAPRVAPPPTLAAAPADAGELAIRDRQQRERIAALEAQLARTTVDRTNPIAMGDVGDAPRPIEMSAGELTALAAQCRFPFDVPPIAGSTMMDEILDRGEDIAKLTDVERAAVRRTIDALQPAYQTELAALYRELTGVDADLDPATLVIEIEQKSPQAELAAAYQQLAAERAGQRPVRPVTATTSVIERYLRTAVAAADNFERSLAASVGAERARAFRRTWGMIDFAPGCPTQ